MKTISVYLPTCYLYINRQIGYVKIDAETARKLKSMNLIEIEEEWETSMFFIPKEINQNNKQTEK